MGGRNAAWQPSHAREQSSGAGVSAAALTGPRAAAQTGTQFRPLVRKPVVAWTPRRQRLGGVYDGAAVDDGGVGPRPVRPNDPAASAPYRLARLPAARPGVPGTPLGREPLRRATSALPAAGSARRGRPHAAA